MDEIHNEIQKTLEKLNELEKGELTIGQKAAIEKGKETIKQNLKYYEDRCEELFKISKRIGKLEKYWFGFSKETDTDHGGIY